MSTFGIVFSSGASMWCLKMLPSEAAHYILKQSMWIMHFGSSNWHILKGILGCTSYLHLWSTTGISAGAPRCSPFTSNLHLIFLFCFYIVIPARFTACSSEISTWLSSHHFNLIVDGMSSSALPYLVKSISVDFTQ